MDTPDGPDEIVRKLLAAEAQASSRLLTFEDDPLPGGGSVLALRTGVVSLIFVHAGSRFDWSLAGQGPESQEWKKVPAQVDVERFVRGKIDELLTWTAR
jgi:hypothetical protein